MIKSAPHAEALFREQRWGHADHADHADVSRRLRRGFSQINADYEGIYGHNGQCGAISLSTESGEICVFIRVNLRETPIFQLHNPKTCKAILIVLLARSQLNPFRSAESAESACLSP